MFRSKKTLKALVLSIGLAAMTFPLDAQVINKGLLQNPYKEQGDQRGMLRARSQGGGYNVSTEQFGSGTNGVYNIGTEQFGNDAPLGSGLFIMAAAGAAYALKKRKMNK